MNHEICQRTIIICNSEEELPTLEDITSFERGIQYQIVFGEKIRDVREQIGEAWKNALPNFLVGIPRIEDRIGIQKLISSEEIIVNQDFFEQCAKDYGELGKKLICQLAEKFKVEIVTATFSAVPFPFANAFANNPVSNNANNPIFLIVYFI